MMTMRNRSGVRQVQFIRTTVSVVLLLVVFCAAVFWRAEAASVLLRMATPILLLRNSFNASESTLLRQELAAARARVADRDVLYAENIDLKNRLHRSAAVQTTLAGVLLRPPAVPYDTLVVDVGTNNGVQVGSSVAAGGTALVGTVSEVYATTARVRLLSAPGNTYEGLLSVKDKTIPVRVEGQGGGSMRARVPAGTGVVVGNAVVLPGILGGYTGSVSYVEVKSGESFESVYLHLPVNPLELRYVEIWNENTTQ